MLVQIPVSVGELIDRITILEIKSEHGLEVSEELEHLKELAPSCVVGRAALRAVNEALWEEEEFTRKYCGTPTLNAKLNDVRFAIKCAINEEFDSELREFKSYGGTS